MAESISIKDIIISMSGEYKNNEILLQSLKRNVIISDKKIKNIRFYTVTEKNPDIGFEMIEKRPSLFKFILLKDKKTNGVVLRSNNDFYVETPCYKVEVRDPITFNEKIDKIINSEFIRNCNFRYESETRKISITPQCLEILICNDKKNSIKLKYESPYNSLKIESSKKIYFTENDLEAILSERIPVDGLNSYFVEQRMKASKTSTVVTPYFKGKEFKTNSVELDLIETDDQIAFVKKFGKNK